MNICAGWNRVSGIESARVCDQKIYWRIPNKKCFRNRNTDGREKLLVSKCAVSPIGTYEQKQNYILKRRVDLLIFMQSFFVGPFTPDCSHATWAGANLVRPFVLRSTKIFFDYDVVESIFWSDMWIVHQTIARALDSGYQDSHQKYYVVSAPTLY